MQQIAAADVLALLEEGPNREALLERVNLAEKEYLEDQARRAYMDGDQILARELSQRLREI